MQADTVAIIVAVITSLGGILAFVDSRKKSRENRALQLTQVEAEAYSKARVHYDAIIEDLTQHIAWLKQELAEKAEENGRLKERIAALEKTVEALKTANVIVIEPPNRG